MSTIISFIVNYLWDNISSSKICYRPRPTVVPPHAGTASRHGGGTTREEVLKGIKTLKTPNSKTLKTNKLSKTTSKRG